MCERSTKPKKIPEELRSAYDAKYQQKQITQTLEKNKFSSSKNLNIQSSVTESVNESSQNESIESNLYSDKFTKMNQLSASVPGPTKQTLSINNSKYTLTKFTEKELENIKSLDAIQSVKELEQIQKLKEIRQKVPYFESVKTCKIRINPSRQKSKEANLTQLSKHTKNQIQAQSFRNMKLEELLQHERGILNLFENSIQIKQYETQHNKEENGVCRGYKRLNTTDYNKIFDRKPTFSEKRAFVGVFRNKWMKDMKYTSIFDRRKFFKQAKCRSESQLLRTQKIKEKFKLKAELTQACKQPFINQDLQDSNLKTKIDWKMLESLYKTQLTSEQNKNYQLFAVPDQTQTSDSIVRILALNQNSAIQSAQRQLINQKYRPKSAKPMARFQLPQKQDLEKQQTMASTQIQLKGTQAVLNPSLQNTNEQSLNYFITELCQMESHEKLKSEDLENLIDQKTHISNNQQNLNRVQSAGLQGRYKNKPFVTISPYKETQRSHSRSPHSGTQEINSSDDHQSSLLIMDRHSKGQFELATVGNKDQNITIRHKNSFSPAIKCDADTRIIYGVIQIEKNSNDQVKASQSQNIQDSPKPNVLSGDAEEIQNQVQNIKQDIDKLKNIAEEQYQKVLEDIKPNVFNLPQNPLTLRSFHYNFIRSRIFQQQANKDKTMNNYFSTGNLNKSVSQSFKSRKSSYLKSKEIVRKNQNKTVQQPVVFISTTDPFILGADLPRKFSTKSVQTYKEKKLNEDLENDGFKINCCHPNQRVSGTVKQKELLPRDRKQIVAKQKKNPAGKSKGHETSLTTPNLVSKGQSSKNSQNLSPSCHAAVILIPKFNQINTQFRQKDTQ